jgi:hypothetical protein
VNPSKYNSEKIRITVLCPNKIKRGGLLYFYSLFPILRKKSKTAIFDFTDSLEYCLEKDKNKRILIVRFLKNNYKFTDIDTTETLRLLREKYDRVTLFDDGARTSIDFPQALPLVDVYFHCQVYRDRNLYTKPLHRGQLYSEYFFKRGIQNNDDYYSVPVEEEHLKKIKVAWNIGAGCYPRVDWLRRAGLLASGLSKPSFASLFYTDPTNSKPPKNREIFDIQARFSIQNEPTIAEQRVRVLEELAGNKSALTGMTSQKQFKKEIRNSKIVVSPFGWGEVCFRDFEAILNGALLLKPSMDYLDTWPDIYLPDETYVPFSWDASDLNEKVKILLSDDKMRRSIAKNAFDVYMSSLDQLDEKVDEMVQLITGR